MRAIKSSPTSRQLRNGQFVGTRNQCNQKRHVSAASSLLHASTKDACSMHAPSLSKEKEKEKAARLTGFALQRTFAGTNVIYEPCYAGRGREGGEGDCGQCGQLAAASSANRYSAHFAPSSLAHLVMRLLKRGPRHISRSCRLVECGECVGDRAKK